MRSKFFLCLLLIVMMFSIAACGNNADNDTMVPDDKGNVGITDDTDMGFDELDDRGDYTRTSGAGVDLNMNKDNQDNNQ